MMEAQRRFMTSLFYCLPFLHMRICDIDKQIAETQMSFQCFFQFFNLFLPINYHRVFQRSANFQWKVSMFSFSYEVPCECVQKNDTNDSDKDSVSSSTEYFKCYIFQKHVFTLSALSFYKTLHKSNAT